MRYINVARIASFLRLFVRGESIVIKIPGSSRSLADESCYRETGLMKDAEIKLGSAAGSLRSTYFADEAASRLLVAVDTFIANMIGHM